MENPVIEEKLYHQHLFRLDDTLNQKLINHMNEYDMTLSGVIRRSLRLFLESEVNSTNGYNRPEKTTTMKK